MDQPNFEYLISSAAWQDSLLQSYRSLHITIQSIMLATSAGLFITVISMSSLVNAAASASVLIIIWIFQLFATKKFKGIITSRGEDVNFWHREIILAEQKLDIENRHFTKFKIYQKLHRNDSDYLRELFLSTEEITVDDVEKLITKGLGHTRNAVDEQLFQRISWIWLAFVLCSLTYVAFRFYVYFYSPNDLLACFWDMHANKNLLLSAIKHPCV